MVRYTDPLNVHSPLTPEEAQDLHRRYAKRKISRHCEHLFRFHYGFMVRIASRYVRPNFPADEAISAAVRGFLEALRRYDPKKGAFTTFSYWWMLKFILREKAAALDVVKLPTLVVRLSRRAQKLRVSMGDDDLAIARELGVNVSELAALEGLHINPRTESISGGDEFPRHPGWQEPADPSPNPREALERKEQPLEEDAIRLELDEALRELSPMERQVVEARHSEDPTSFESLGRRYGCSREQVRKVFLAAMDKIKRYCGTL